MQAANTGLTGGSTPAAPSSEAGGYDREVVIVSTLRMDRIRLLGGGRQALCFPGATLHRLEWMLKPLGREPHSVIGSSCIGASVMGGVLRTTRAARWCVAARSTPRWRCSAGWTRTGGSC